MNLFEWHNYFEDHYKALHKQRTKDNTPVFMFEHELDPRNLNELKQSIHEHLLTFAPDGRYWLPWIVYATEIGYEFDGHEYWHSFQEKTPNWLIYGNRPFIRDGFKKFVKLFGGFKPAGIWADHFNIISYPITHAILPRDLQRQLAKVLYDLRFHFNRSLLQSTEQLGNMILSRSEGTTKRFQQFAQNIELTGLIARELLSHNEKQSDTIISLSTLKRIVEDLRLQRDAGSWLDEARDKAQFAAKDRVSRYIRTGAESDGASTFKLEPKLLLRPTGEKSWDLYIDIPDLLPLTRHSTELNDFLTSSRPRINGSYYDKRLARGRLVSYGFIQEKLKTLPDNKTLLIFRRDKPQLLEKFLKENFRIETRENYLFKIQGDGIAYMQKSTFVSAGSHYLILSRNTIPINSLFSKQNVSCENLNLYSIKIPKSISNQEERLLAKLGLATRLEVNISPVGTTPSVWDEETYIEFLANESPCLSVKLNHEVQALRIKLGNNQLDLTDPEVGKLIYINLPYLPIGSHEFFVSGKRHDQSNYSVFNVVKINIREPRSQHSSTTSQNILLLFTDPYKPTYEQFFAGKVNFDFWTPPGITAKVYLTLVSKYGDDTKMSPKKELTTVSLPDDSHKLNSNIFEYLQDSSIRRESEDAHSCFLEFEAGELGSVSINFEREYLPLKWQVKADKNKIFLRLSDYSDSDEKIFVTSYNFLTPDQRKTISYNENHDLGFPITSNGGLFIAETSQIRQGIIVLRQLERSSFKSFTDLRQEDGIIPTFSKYTRTVEDLSKLLNIYVLWTSSLSVGSVLRKNDINVVLNAFLLEIISLIDEDRGWRKAELQYRMGKSADVFSLSKAVSSKPLLAEKLLKISTTLRFASTDEWVDELVLVLGDEVPVERTKIQKQGQVPHIKVIHRDWFAEFALRLCSQPETLQGWADKRYELGLSKMLAHPTLVRAARYFVLTANRNKSLSHKWEWE